MSKIFNARKWLTLDEASRVLTIQLNEPVDASTLIRLAIERTLTPSVYFSKPIPVIQAISYPANEVPVEAKKNPNLQLMLLENRIHAFDPDMPFPLETSITNHAISGVFELAELANDELLEDVYAGFNGHPLSSNKYAESVIFWSPDRTSLYMTATNNQINSDGQSKPKYSLLDSTDMVVIQTSHLNSFCASLLDTAPINTLNKQTWPDHETSKLQALRLAAIRFWKNFDPTDPSTAPTNEDVSNWLQREHKLSASLSDAMATILRIDGLRTGPR